VDDELGVRRGRAFGARARRGFLALAKLQAGSRPEMQTMMQSLELGGTGKTVALSFSIPAQVFETLAPQMRHKAQ
jgi:hypothetical protein